MLSPSSVSQSGSTALSRLNFVQSIDTEACETKTMFGRITVGLYDLDLFDVQLIPNQSL